MRKTAKILPFVGIWILQSSFTFNTGMFWKGGASAPSCDPGDVSDMTLYVDAHDTANLWQDDGKTTPVTGNGQVVGNWTSQTSAAEFFEQLTATNKPTYLSSAINGHPAIDFDGVDNWMYSQVLDQFLTLALVWTNVV